ncbi:MAG: tRNA pseudouridine(38-40) synthase TruA [Candidatus Omnitrophica bacterium]|nr:tRNA pseudouridine(38-40) synthase TruA [Candidatus Omnitrophota bacterium]
MKNILLKIEYDGTNYRGWQRQASRELKGENDSLTVQEVIETALKDILKEKVSLISSGRTDAGVHAKSQYANFRAATSIPLNKMGMAINALLPSDIRVLSVRRVPDSFHSRYDVKTKVYRYVILNRKYCSVFLRQYVLHIPKPQLDVSVMQKESKVLIGRHDFKSFQASDKKVRGSIRTIKDISVKKSRGLILIDVEADGFLYNMVRNIVGTLIEVGRGKRPKNSLKNILLVRDRRCAGPTVPAKGLTLLKVRYKNDKT